MKARSGFLPTLRTPLSFLLTLLLCGSAAVVVLAQCLTNLTSTDVICAKQPGSDGKKHITVSVSGGTSDEQALIQSALDAWNAHSGTTGVVFDAVASGASADYQVIYTSDTSQATGTAGCARQSPDTNTIHWGEDLRSRRASLGDAEFTAIFAHEIGHILALAHTNDATIMRPGSSCQSPSGSTSVSASDAQKVASCLASACPAPTPTPRPSGGGGGGGTPGRTCGYEPVINPTYDREGPTGYEIEYEYICS